MPQLTIGEFRQLTEHLAADTPIVVPTNYCHEFRDEYRHGTAVIDTALFGHSIIEDLGEGATPEAHYGKRRKVVVIR